VANNGRKRRPHDSPDYRRRRDALMRTATPFTKCIRCGRRLQDHPPHRNGRPATWHAGHVIDGDNRGALALEASTCNTAAGGALGNQRRWGPDRVPGASRATARSGDSPRWPHFPGHFDLENPTSVGGPPCVLYGGAMCPVCQDHRKRNSKPKG
jgi:hypothetical protein